MLLDQRTIFPVLIRTKDHAGSDPIDGKKTQVAPFNGRFAIPLRIGIFHPGKTPGIPQR
jgi:hypothetical protein